MAASAIPVPGSGTWELLPVAAFPSLRVLAWDGFVLYASRGYQLLRADLSRTEMKWCPVGRSPAGYFRSFTASSSLTSRLMRDGFHALAVLPSSHLVAAVPGAIATLAPGETEFRISHKLLRGTRPLHITATPSGSVFWGEYFDNADGHEV